MTRSPALRRRGFVFGVFALASLSLASWSACAQDFPTRAIRVVVPWAPGGLVDGGGRLLADALTKSMGQSVVVENVPGAAGALGADQVAKAAPDGYTLLMAASSFAAAPAFHDNLGWDPLKSFTPVAQVAVVPILAVTTPGLGVKNVQELVSVSKARPGALNMASPGPTTVTRLAGEQFKQLAGVDWVTVHYKGGAPAMQDMLGGTAQVMFANISDVIAQVKAGKLQPIAVTSRTRSAVAPDIPTFREAGYPESNLTTWQAVVGPAGLPPAIVSRLNSEIRKALNQPQTQAQFLGMGTEVSVGSADELGALLAEEVPTIKRLAKSVGAGTN